MILPLRCGAGSDPAGGAAFRFAKIALTYSYWCDANGEVSRLSRIDGMASKYKSLSSIRKTVRLINQMIGFRESLVDRR
jgi:hypothetical protein